VIAAFRARDERGCVLAPSIPVDGGSQIVVLEEEAANARTSGMLCGHRTSRRRRRRLFAKIVCPTACRRSKMKHLQIHRTGDDDQSPPSRTHVPINANGRDSRDDGGSSSRTTYFPKRCCGRTHWMWPFMRLVSIPGTAVGENSVVHARSVAEEVSPQIPGHAHKWKLAYSGDPPQKIIPLDQRHE